MEQAGVQLIAAGGDVYISTMSQATKVTNTFVDATDKGAGKVSAAGQVMIGGLRKVGEFVVDSFAEATKATAAFLKGSVDLAGDFDAGMREFQAVAGSDVDTSGLEQFKDLFIDIGKRLPVSTSEVQQAAIEMVKGGIDPAIVAAGGLEQNIQFAAAAMKGDLVKAAEISSKLLGGWAEAGASAAEQSAFLTHSTDLLTKAANASSVDVEELSRGIFNAQGIAKVAGVSFDDLTTTLAELAPRFASSSEAGTSLKNMIARLQPTTKPAIAAMEGLGLITAEGNNQFYDAKGNFVGMSKASQLLQESMHGLTKQQQASVLQTIFGNDAMGSAAGLAELGAKGYAEMAAKMEKANGVAATAALIQGSFNTKLDNAKGSIEALQITIGTALLPVLGELLDKYISPAINAVTSFADKILGASDPMLAFASAIHQWSAPLGSIAFYLTEVARGGEGVDAWLKETPALFQGLVGGIQGAISFFEKLIEIDTSIVNALSSGDLSGAIDIFTGAIQDAAPVVLEAVSSWGQALVDWVAPYIPIALKALNDLVDQAWAWVKDQSPGWIKQLGVWGQSFADWVIDSIPLMFKALDDLIGKAQDWIKQEAPGWGKQLLAWGNELVEWVAPMIPPALAELGKLGDQFLGWIGGQAAPILARLQTWATSFVAWIPGATVTFLAKWPVMFDQFLDWVGKAAGPLLKQLGDWAISFIQWIAPMIPPFLVALGGIALAIGVWVVETAAVLAGKIVNTWVPAIIGWIVTDAVPGLYKALESIWKVFQGWILDLEQDLAQKMRDVGTNIIAGIVKGVEGAAGSLMSTLKSLASDALQAAKDALGISSPSTAFMPVGKFMVEGIMAGFSAMWPQLTALVSNMSDDLIKQVADIGEQVNGMIADSFGATASIDRQIAKNLSSFKDVLPAYQASVQGMLKDAEQQARAFLDPAEGAKFFKMRSNQILEYAKLQKDLADEQQAIVDSGTAQSAEMAKSDQLRAQLAGDLTDEQRTALEAQLSITENLVEKDAIRARLAADLTDTQRESVEKQLAASQIAQDAQIAARKDAIAMIATLQQQMLLINQAQAAEISQFDANKAAQGNPMQDLIDQIQQLFNNSKKADLEKQYAEAKTDAERERIRKLIEDAAIPINDTGIGHDLQALIQLLTKIFNVQGAAGGGPVESGQPYWVGEQGPELFWPQMNGMVSPAASSAQMAARGNQTNYSTTYNNTMPIYTNNSPGALQQSWAIMQASMP